MMEFQGSLWEYQFVTTNERPIGPRMSNERIDLTQFEHDANNPPEEIDCADCGRTIESEDGTNFFACNRCGWSGYPSDAQAIEMVDELVAELKKHYELLDKIVHIWFCSPHISEEHHADITKLLADYWGKTL